MRTKAVVIGGGLALAAVLVFVASTGLGQQQSVPSQIGRYQLHRATGALAGDVFDTATGIVYTITMVDDEPAVLMTDPIRRKSVGYQIRLTVENNPRKGKK